MSLLTDATNKRAADSAAAQQKAIAKREARFDTAYEQAMRKFPYLGLNRTTATHYQQNARSWSSGTTATQFVGDDDLRFVIFLDSNNKLSGLAVMQECPDCHVKQKVDKTLYGIDWRSDDEHPRDKFVADLAKHLGVSVTRCSDCNRLRQQNRCAFCGRV